MDTVTTIIIIIGGYCILLFFDLFFKSCAHYPYLKLLDGLGLNISLFSLTWKTKALNRQIIKWGNIRPHFWMAWFQVGVYISILFLPITLYILFSSILDVFTRSSQDGLEPLVTPVIPGINLPLSEIGYYSATLLICSIFHELGHALAAVLEDIGTLELGCKIYFVLPIAYVSLPTDKLRGLSLTKRLKIYTAGIWHNIFLSLMAYLLYSFIPTLVSPLYDYGNSVSISKVSENSPLKDAHKGLFVNDIVFGINDCKITNENDWFDCLNKRDALVPAVCITSDLVNTLDESIPVKHISSGYVECCDTKSTQNLCFEYIDVENNELELQSHACLPGRIVMEQSNIFCTMSPHSCPYNLYCFRPLLPNNTYLIKIVSKSRNIIYLGHPNDLFQTIEVSSYTKKHSLFSVNFPDKFTKLVKYLVVISLGLAFVNVLPIVFMDGEYMYQALALIIFENRVRKKLVIQTVNIITWISTFLLVIYLIYTGALLF